MAKWKDARPGVGGGLGANKEFTGPDSVGGLVLWTDFNAAYTDRIEYPANSNLNFDETNVFGPPWGSNNTSSVTIDPSTYDGSPGMLTITGDASASGYPYATQWQSITGCRYEVHLHAMTPSVNPISSRAGLYVPGSHSVPYTLIDDTWHTLSHYEESYTLTGGYFNIVSGYVVNGDTNYFDDVQVNSYSVNRVRSIIGPDFIQPTASHMPFISRSHHTGEWSVRSDDPTNEDYMYTENAVDPGNTSTEWTMIWVGRGKDTFNAFPDGYYIPLSLHDVGQTWVGTVGNLKARFRDGLSGQEIYSNDRVCPNSYHVYTAVSTASGVELWIDGVYQNISPGPQQRTLNEIAYVGSKTYLPQHNANYGEAIIYNKPLSHSELNQIHDYLINKYKIKEYLPSHVYGLKHWWGFANTFPEKSIVDVYSESSNLSIQNKHGDVTSITNGVTNDTLFDNYSTGIIIDDTLNHQYFRPHPSIDSVNTNYSYRTHFNYIHQTKSYVGMIVDFNSDISTTNLFLSTNFSGNPSNGGFRFERISNKIGARYTDGAGVTILSIDNRIHTGKVFILSVFDPSTFKLDLYIDGALAATSTETSFDTTNDATLSLFVGHNDSSYSIYDGYVYDVFAGDATNLIESDINIFNEYAQRRMSTLPDPTWLPTDVDGLVLWTDFGAAYTDRIEYPANSNLNFDETNVFGPPWSAYNTSSVTIDPSTYDGSPGMLTVTGDASASGYPYVRQSIITGCRYEVNAKCMVPIGTPANSRCGLYINGAHSSPYSAVDGTWHILSHYEESYTLTGSYFMLRNGYVVNGYTDYWDDVQLNSYSINRVHSIIGPDFIQSTTSHMPFISRSHQTGEWSVRSDDPTNDDYMVSESVIEPGSSSTEWTVTWVGRSDDPDPAGYYMPLSIGPVSTAFIGIPGSTRKARFADSISGVVVQSLNEVCPNSYHVYTVNSTSSGVELWIDGEYHGKTSTPQGKTLNDIITIGGGNVFPQKNSNYGEAIVYNRSILREEIYKLHAYLMNKHKVDHLLPSNVYGLKHWWGFANTFPEKSIVDVYTESGRLSVQNKHGDVASYIYTTTNDVMFDEHNTGINIDDTLNYIYFDSTGGNEIKTESSKKTNFNYLHQTTSFVGVIGYFNNINYPIFAHTNMSADKSYGGFRFMRSPSNVNVIYVDGGGTNLSSINYTYTDKKIFMLSVIDMSSMLLKLYINGVHVASAGLAAGWDTTQDCKTSLTLGHYTMSYGTKDAYICDVFAGDATYLTDDNIKTMNIYAQRRLSQF